MKTDWDDPDNAAAYRRFTEDFAMYADTSRWLVDRAHLSHARTVVDLCSGTGATTETILSAAGPDARVIALDGAAAMHAEGR